MYVSYETQPEDLDGFYVKDEAIVKYIRKAASLPEALDVEVLDDGTWFTQGASGEWVIDGPLVGVSY